jgi:hypothetical protein
MELELRVAELEAERDDLLRVESKRLAQPALDEYEKKWQNT